MIEAKLRELGIEPTPTLLRLLRGVKTNISIPNKVEKTIREDITSSELFTIHPDSNTAIELILLIVSNLSDTYHRSLYNTTGGIARGGYKNLYSPILSTQVKYNNNTPSPYAKILGLLIKYNVIEKGRNYSKEAKRSNEYRLTNKYFGKGIIHYIISTDVARRLRVKEFNTNFQRVLATSIGKNSMLLRSRTTFPSTEEVKTHLKSLTKARYTNKKGKRLVTKGKKSYNPEHYVFIEEYIQRYEYLRDVLIIPIIDITAGTDARIIDFYNMMPSAIREILPIMGEKFIEVDFSTLHPNITQKLWGDNTTPISHDKVAEDLAILNGRQVSRAEVKVKHLSFFNKKWEQMQADKEMFEYYWLKDKQMMININKDKYDNGYKNTAKRLFQVETNLMENIVTILMDRGIQVGYVFDAIYCLEGDKETVRSVMNAVAAHNNILTTAI